MSKKLDEDRTEWSEEDIQYAHDRSVVTADEANELLELVGSDFRYDTDPTSAPPAKGEPVGPLGGSAQAAEDNYDDMTVAELKEELDSQGVEYMSDDRKADLVSRLRNEQVS